MRWQLQVAISNGRLPLQARPEKVTAEDDGELRELLTEQLTERGADVVACEHGIALVEELDRAFGPAGRYDVDMVITDIRMPGVTGMSVLEGAQRLGPPVPDHSDDRVRRRRDSR